jgi:hypothetical protein
MSKEKSPSCDDYSRLHCQVPGTKGSLLRSQNTATNLIMYKQLHPLHNFVLYSKAK